MSTPQLIIQSAVEAVRDEPAEVRAAVAAAAAVSAIPAPTPSDSGWLWRALIIGLVVILGLALGGVIYVVADGSDTTSPDVLVTIFSSALTGLIGLFVRSPTAA